MCDRNIDSETSVSIYGNLEDMIVELQPYHRNGTGELVPTIEFDSTDPCTYRPSKVTVAKIFFLCDPTAYTPLLSIKYEDYLECEIEINFATVAACIGFQFKYSCGDGYACRPSADGTQTREECMSQCIGTHPVSVSVSVSIAISICTCTYASMCLYAGAHIIICVLMFMYVYIYINRMHLDMYVCVSVFLYVFVCFCVCVSVCICNNHNSSVSSVDFCSRSSNDSKW